MNLLNRSLLVFPLAKLLVHVCTSGGWGYFRDELYYLACADHLDWGYVDHPPFSIIVLKVTRALLSDALWAIRTPPAVAGALTVWVTGLIARDLGGGPFARALAMLCAIVAPQFLGIDSFFSMNAFDTLAWSGAALLLVRIISRGREEDSRNLWILLGVVLGLGLQNKISVLWLIAGIAAGLILTAERRRLLRAGPWMAAAIAIAIFIPHVLWQVAHGWPTLEFIRNATSEKMAGLAPMEFAVAQVQNMHPATLPVWAAGLLWCFLAAHGRRWRPVGITFVVVALILIVNEKSRAGYLAPAYIALYAAGAVAIEGFTRSKHRWIRLAMPALLLIGGIVTAPLALPLLPADRYVTYATALGVQPSTEEKQELATLPQFVADHFGWPEMTAQIARAYQSLPPEERQHAAIFTSNYGEAGAVDLFGRAYGLPRAISGHNNYWLWGPRGASGDVVIAVTVPASKRLPQVFESVTAVADIDCGWCMPYESQRVIYVCRRPRAPLAEVWSKLKHYN